MERERFSSGKHLVSTRRGHLVKFLPLMLLLLLCGCAGSMRNLAPQHKPIYVNKSHLEPLSFKGVVIRIPAGEEVGKHHEGLAKVPKWSHIWQSGLSFGSEEFTLRANETLIKNGYNVVGRRDILFDPDNSAKARYQLGATIVNLRYNTFGGLAGNHNEAVVYVDWQLYDALKERVVFEHSTNGFAKMSPRTKPAVFDAFGRALENLLAEGEFVAELLSDKPELASEQGNRVTLAVGTVATGERNLPDHHIDNVLPSIVTVRVGSTVGSGVVVSPDGYVLTAAHVVDGVEKAQLRFPSGLTLEASVERRNNRQDVALLRLPGGGHKSLPVTLSGKPRLGSSVFVIGTPSGEELSFSVTRGVVSGLREFDGFQYIQTDASVNPGNSGGPILDEAGRVIGIVSWKIAGVNYEGLAFGVPTGVVEESLDIEFQPVR